MIWKAWYPSRMKYWVEWISTILETIYICRMWSTKLLKFTTWTTMKKRSSTSRTNLMILRLYRKKGNHFYIFSQGTSKFWNNLYMLLFKSLTIRFEFLLCDHVFSIMMVVFNVDKSYHIDLMNMNGLGPRITIEGNKTTLVGPKVSLCYDRDLKQLFWSDQGTGRIGITTIPGLYFCHKCIKK